MPPLPAAHSRIYFVTGGGSDFIDVQETVGVITEGLVWSALPGKTLWVTYQDGSRVWVNANQIVRIEPK